MLGIFISVSFLCLLLYLLNSTPWKLRQSHKFFAYGPTSYPMIGCMISFYKNGHRLLDWYTDLLSSAPTQTIIVSRLGARRAIVTANPENVKYILKTNFYNFPKGKPFQEILEDFLGNGIFNVDGDLWYNQRKLASQEFSTRSLRDYAVKSLKEEVDKKLLPLLESVANDTKKTLDLQDLLGRVTFDVVCKVSLGYDPSLSKPLTWHRRYVQEEVLHHCLPCGRSRDSLGSGPKRGLKKPLCKSICLWEI
ncbi:Cytochrome [Forsythia ovata]|uniref:Cytochrome n=1 Tax=Forsythia ovata TaxID=205694 RepID=A0ABD1UWP7_9LAMI